MEHAVIAKENQADNVTGGPLTDWFTKGLQATIKSRGYSFVEENARSDEGGIFLYPLGPDGPKELPPPQPRHLRGRDRRNPAVS